MKITTTTLFLGFSFLIQSRLSVNECTGSSCCSSNGLCAVFMGCQNNFKNLRYDINLVCFAKTVSPAPVFTRIPASHHSVTRLHLIPGFREPGSVLVLGQVTQYGHPYLICITKKGRQTTISGRMQTLCNGTEKVL